MARPAKRMPVPLRWRIVKWVFLAGLFLAVLPVAQVGCTRWVRPPVTSLMLLRAAEAKVWREYHGGIDFRWLPWKELPDDFLRSVLAAEDARFFQHRGFDWHEMSVALAHAERTGKPARGSSTITQQCARSLFLWTGRNFIRKGLEAYYTFWMETFLSKQRILELYANVVELGDGIYGVEAAAQKYYGIPASRLAPSQASMLAALLGAPRRWNPLAPSPRLKGRHRRIERELANAPLRWPPGFR